MDEESSPDNWFMPGTVEYPTGVPYRIQKGTPVVDQSPAFNGAHLTVKGNDEEGELEAMLNDIRGDHGDFTSLEEASVRTHKGATVPKLRGWKFSAARNCTARRCD